MRKELVFVLLALFLCAGCNGNKKKMNGEHDLDAANITLDDHTISFYYNWYGNPSVDGEMKHWMHPIAPAPGHSGDAGAISGLDSDGLDCYASFSPNGIVPQKMPLTLLHNDMPVIRADYDIVDHDYRKATDVIVERVEKRPVPFHWFRAILKSPSWYKGICDELKQRHTNIELLDAPTFFELYRIYLKQHPDAAAGKITMN